VSVTEGVTKTLRELGVSLSLDEFETGYSNFSLAPGPADHREKERLAVHSTLDSGNRRGTAFVRDIVNLGHSLRLSSLVRVWGRRRRPKHLWDESHAAPSPSVVPPGP
jgi:EAL domain-containing protein (putative c-di-GMP-specific phosphodiesterase class I)